MNAVDRITMRRADPTPDGGALRKRLSILRAAYRSAEWPLDGSDGMRAELASPIERRKSLH